MQFKSLDFEKFDRVLDLSQLALLDARNATVFLHREKDANPATDSFVQDIKNIALRMPDLNAVDAAADTPGLPPSSSQTFVRARPLLATVTLTDHAGPYANQYFHSQFDDSTNLAGHPEDLKSPDLPLCQVATLAARVLYHSIARNPSAAVEDSISADCVLVSRLW